MWATVPWINQKLSAISAGNPADRIKKIDFRVSCSEGRPGNSDSGLSLETLRQKNKLAWGSVPI